MNNKTLITSLRLMEQMKMHTLYFEYHLTLANTGQAKKLKLFHGINGPEFTDDEKIAHAIEIAHNHIKLIEELSEKLMAIMEESDGEELTNLVGALQRFREQNSTTKH